MAALFVDPAGPYPELLGSENCWDESRDARLYQGRESVVAHPPCYLWVNFAAVNWKRYQKDKPAWYPGGSDGGCFASALASVRRCGGVLEHPAGSWAWATYGLRKPAGLGWQEGYFGSGGHRQAYWVCEVWQSAYGHPARKRTWLLYVGYDHPPELDWWRKPGTHQVGWFDRKKPTLSKKQASRTPVAFAQKLIELALWSRL